MRHVRKGYVTMSENPQAMTLAEAVGLWHGLPRNYRLSITIEPGDDTVWVSVEHFTFAHGWANSGAVEETGTIADLVDTIRRALVKWSYLPDSERKAD